jgi:beta-glucanase (GH16 family)
VNSPRSRGLAAAALAAILAAILAAGLVVASSSPGATSTAPAGHEAAKRQKATISVLPPIAQFGPRTAPSDAASTVISTEFSPPQKGRKVVLTRQVKGTWKAVATTRQNAKGLAVFTAPTRIKGKAVTYRATALAHKKMTAVTTVSVSSTRWGAPDFVDEFSGSALSSPWGHRVQTYDPSGLRTCSKGSPDAVAVTSGALRLSVLLDPARAEPCTAYRADGSAIGQFRYRLNGHVTTEERADFRYGVAAAQMRFHQSRGQHASFWLQPTPYRPQATSASEGGAEIDVIEYFGDGGNKGGLASFVYHPTPAGSRAKVGGFVDPVRFLGGRSDRWFRNYHVFSVEWTPTEYVFRIDGRETWRTSAGVSSVSQYPILSLLSSDYELENLGSESRLPQHMYVDWVQFWES